MAAALAWVLLLGQALGLAHGIAHEAGQPAPVAATVHHAHGDLFAGHEQGGDVCELLDQIGHADVLPLDTLSSAAPTPTEHVNPAPVRGLALRWAAGYNARAPPFILV
jgi:hypothetical protein